MADASSSSDSEDENNQYILLTLLLLRRNRRRRRAANRNTWCRSWIKRRTTLGMYTNLVQELNAEDPAQFRAFHRLDRESFFDVLTMVEPFIIKQDTLLRSAIPANERLSLTLRFLATGETFESLSMQFRVGSRTVSSIIEETTKALYLAMKDTYLKTPETAEEWRKIADEFEARWNYPCCIGAVDGKHIAIKQPNNSGSEYFNYKHFFSVLLLAIADSNYKFTYINTGAAGRAGDAGVYNESTIKQALIENSINLPPAKAINGIKESNISYHLVGDDAFALSTTMMKPFPHRSLNNEKRIFNYRLSRARRVIENAFGIMANRFRILLSTINLQPDKVTYLVLAICCLHNYLIEKNKHTYTSVSDLEEEDHNLSTGIWRNDPSLTGMAPTMEKNPTKNAKTQRDLLAAYFSSETGAVPWQDAIIGLQ